MQITCPSCEAVYAVPDEKLGGRAVKCARCSTTWMPPPPPIRPMDAPEIEHVPAPRQPAMLPPPEPQRMAAAEPLRRAEPQWPFIPSAPPARPEPRPKGLMVAWIASIALLGAVVAGAYARRDAVMEAWPPSQRAYAVFGLH